MKHKLTIYLFIAVSFLVLFAVSCKRVINLDLNNAKPQLVIEANITNIFGPQIVKISQTVPFSNTNVYPAVSGAVVNVSDSTGHIHNFVEGPPGTYTAQNFGGRAGVTYTLNVLYSGINYTASSTMPYRVKLDSINAQTSPFGGKNSDNISVYYQDPAGMPNYYNFLMYVNSAQVDRIFAFDDQFTDGRYVSNELFQSDITINSGDTVKIVMQCTDKNVYTYWYSLMQQQQQGPGGGTTPSNPPSNINNNALGYFSAHTTQSLILVVR
jgi:hypothetical protein